MLRVFIFIENLKILMDLNIRWFNGYEMGHITADEHHQGANQTPESTGILVTLGLLIR